MWRAGAVSVAPSVSQQRVIPELKHATPSRGPFLLRAWYVRDLSWVCLAVVVAHLWRHRPCPSDHVAGVG